MRAPARGTRAHRRGASCRGAALVTALAGLIAVTAVGVAVASRTVESLADARLDLRSTEARLAAEGAVEAARAALARDSGWPGGDRVVGGASTRVDVQPGASAEERRVVAVARVAPQGDRGVAAQAVVDATLVLGDGLPRIALWRER